MLPLKIAKLESMNYQASEDHLKENRIEIDSKEVDVTDLNQQSQGSSSRRQESMNRMKVWTQEEELKLI